MVQVQCVGDGLELGEQRRHHVQRDGHPPAQGRDRRIHDCGRDHVQSRTTGARQNRTGQ